MTRSVKILIVFLSMLAVALVYAYINWPRQARVASRPATAPRAVVPSETADMPATNGVALQEPEGGQDDSPVVIRNIFAPLFSVPARPARPAIKTPVPPPDTVGSIEPPPPPPRPRPFFVGMLRYEGRQRVFFSFAGEVYVVGPGDRFGPDNKFRLLKVSPQSLTVQHDDDVDSFEIAAEEQPISILSAPGASYQEPQAPMEAFVPSEPETTVPSEPGTTVPSEPGTAVPSEPATTVPSEPGTTVPSEPEPINGEVDIEDIIDE